LELSVLVSLGNISGAVDAAGTLTVIPQENWHGDGWLRVGVTEKGGGGRSETVIIPVRVVPVNDAPVILKAGITTYIDEDGKAVFHLDSAFSEPEGEQMIFSAFTRCEQLQLSLGYDGTLGLVPEPDWSGTCDVTIIAFDPWGESASGKLMVVVNGTNDPPEAVIEPHSRIMEYGDTDAILRGRGTDLDGAIDDYKWMADNDTLVGNSSHLNVGTFDNLTPGLHSIQLFVRDDEGAWSLPAKTAILLTKLDLVVEDFNVNADDVTEGETVRITVTLRNIGNGDAKNVSLRFLLDGKELEIIRIPFIIAGEAMSCQADWTALSGSHEISVEIADGDTETILLGVEEPIVKQIIISEESEHWILLAVGICGLLILIPILLLPSFLRRRRRRVALRSLRGSITEVGMAGIGAEESVLLLSDLEKSYRIRPD